MNSMIAVDRVFKSCRDWLPKVISTSLVFGSVLSLAPNSLAQTMLPANSNQVTINVGSNVVRSYTTNPLRLGMNISSDIITFPTAGGSDTLWDTNKDVITPALYNFLGTDFTGAVYRFPGGCNEYDWYRMVGSYASRAANQEFYDYGQYTAYFGVPEFMKFVEQAHGGSPIIILNLLKKDGVVISDANWPAAVQNLVGFLEYLNAPSNQDWNGDGVFEGAQRAADGHSAPYNIFRFELGNELDMNGTMTVQQYTSRCQDIINAFNQHPIAGQPYHFTCLSTTVIYGNPTWENWNNSVLASLGSQIDSLAAHTYYDGYSVPWNIGNDLTIANDIDKWASNTGIAKKPNIAVTEHARYAQDNNVKSTWPNDVNLDAAVSTGDMIISQEQDPSIGMSLGYTIANGSPWSLFMPSNSSGYIDPAPFSPEPSAWAQKLISRVMQNVNILTTTVTTPANSGYNVNAGPPSSPAIAYDVRATGYQNSYGQFGVLAINRAAQSYPLTMTLPEVPSNYSGAVTMQVDQVNGAAAITTRVQTLSAVNGTVTATLGPNGVYNFMVLTLGAYGITPWNIPGTVQAENYDLGGLGIAYSVGSNNGTDNAYRPDGVDLETCYDTGGGVDLGWTAPGQQFKYTVNVATTGTYIANFRVAAPYAVSGAFHVTNVTGSDITGPVNIPATGGWQNWTTVSVPVTLNAGTQVLTLNPDAYGYNVNYMNFVSMWDPAYMVHINAGGGTASPYAGDTYFSGGQPAPAAGTIDTTLLTGTIPPQSVLNTNRYGAFSYTIPGFTAGSAHWVTLYFAETYWRAPGQRTFNVSANGVSELSNFDIFATAGAQNKAVQQSFPVSADSNGQITLNFTNVVDNAQVNGILIN